MGSEASTERKQREDNKNEKMIQQILEQQRKIYEDKCKEMLRHQQKVTICVARKSTEVLERSNVQNTKSVTQAPLNTHTPLYPNLEETPANIQFLPSTSRAPYNASNIQRNIGASTTVKSNPVCNTSYNNLPSGPAAALVAQPAQSKPSNLPSAPAAPLVAEPAQSKPSNLPSAPAAPLVAEPAQSKPRAQNRYQSRNNEWMCISCNRSLGTKIYNCTQGHSSCSDCKFKGIKCGICKNSLTNTRNISLESYIAEVQSNVPSNTEVIVNCPNKNDGCKLSIKQDRVEKHIKECPFREMSCPVASDRCSWKGKINHIREHFLECHPEVTETNVDTETKLNANNRKQIMHHIIMGSFNFLVHLKLDSQALYMAVQLIGTSGSASKWTYEFHVYDKSAPRRKYMYNDTCLSNTIPFTDIYNESKCAKLQYQYAMSFVKDNALTYKFYIKKEINDQKRGGPKQRGRGRQ